MTSPSIFSAARRRLRLFCNSSSFFAPMRAAARSQSFDSVPVAPSATSLRISRSSRPACLRTRSPSPFGRDFLERAVEQRGKRLHRLSVAALADEHEREIVAQRREIAISGEQRGLQVAAGQRIALALRHSAGEMKRDVRLKFYLHAEIALVVFV